MIELLHIFVENILPIMAVAAVGFYAGRYLGVDARSLGRLTFNVFSPALVFNALTTTELAGSELGLLILLTALFQLSMAGIAYLTMRFQRASKVHKAGVMLNAFCLNAGNYGLSLVDLAFGPAVLARAVVVFVANTILNNTLGVFVASSGSKPPKQALANIFRVPAIYSAVIALTLRGLGIEIHPSIHEPIQLLAGAAIPSMLILLGLQLNLSTGIKHPRLVSISVGLKLLVAPVVALAFALLFHVEGPAKIALILQASMPVAVVTLILAGEFGLDKDLTLSAIVASTLLSPLTLSVVILFLRES